MWNPALIFKDRKYLIFCNRIACDSASHLHLHNYLNMAVEYLAATARSDMIRGKKYNIELLFLWK